MPSIDLKLVTLFVARSLKRMRLFFVLAFLAISQSAVAGEIEEVLALPEEKIDIGIAALILAKEIYSNLDVAAYSRKIDVLAGKVRWLAKDAQDPEQRIRALNTVLFLHEGFRYDRDPLSRNRQEYYFLNGILDSKQGICYTLPLLYLAVAQRVGYPIFPVAAPDHLFVRYAVPGFQEQNIEVTSGGKYFPDETYITDFSISLAGRNSGSYLRTLSYKEFLGHLLMANALVHGRQGNGQKMLSYIERAALLNPRFADNYVNLAEVYRAKSKAVTGEAAVRYRKNAARYAAKAKALGFVGTEQIAIGRKIRGG